MLRMIFAAPPCSTRGLLAVALALAASPLLASSQRSNITIDSLLGDPIPARISVPNGPVPQGGFPACIVLHGSGGLLRENDPGQACGPQLEGNYEALFQTLENLGVVVLAPDSFGRSVQFCEDNNDDYLQFAPPPFFNPGDGVIERSDEYKIRRIQTRVLDAGGALKHLQQMANVDPQRICAVGTSNGGSVALVLSTNATGRHAAQFADVVTQRPHESGGNFIDRQLAFANYPAIPAATQAQFDGLPVLKFTQAISPGCFVRKMIPTVDPDSVAVVDWPDDFFHPESARDEFVATELHAEMGADDSVPDHCRVDGIRHRQAVAYETAFAIAPARWLPTEYPGFGHDLLGDNPLILEKFEGLVIHHFFDSVFADGYE